MTLNINQFGLTPVQGQIDLPNLSSVISGRVDKNLVTALVAGQPVKLVDIGGGAIVFTALTANTDVAFGYVARNLKDATFPADSAVEIATNFSVLYMTAGAAIARGAKIENVYTTIKVITNAGTNPVSGYTLDKATADGDLIRVMVINSATSAQVIADVAGLRSALNVRGNGIAQIETTISTVGAGTLTAASIVGQNILRSGSTAAFIDTTDTAAAIVAALPSPEVGESFVIKIKNTTAFTQTLAAGASVTLPATVIIAPFSVGIYLVTLTNVITPAVTLVYLAEGRISVLDNNSKLSTAQLDRASSTVLTTVTGCSVPLVAGGKYIVKAHISGTATANGGVKVALAGDGTLSATSFTASGCNYNGTTLNAQTTTTTLGTAVGAATAVFTNARIEGAIVVNVAGVLSLQFAQNASHVDTSSAYVNSTLSVTRVA